MFLTLITTPFSKKKSNVLIESFRVLPQRDKSSNTILVTLPSLTNSISLEPPSLLLKGIFPLTPKSLMVSEYFSLSNLNLSPFWLMVDVLLYFIIITDSLYIQHLNIPFIYEINKLYDTFYCII